jgi:hypothetical protein
MTSLPSSEEVDQLVLHFNAFKHVATFGEIVEMAEEAIKEKEIGR